MPPARKTARSSSRRGTTFKEPAALKRLNRSIDAAQNALSDLRANAGRNAGESTRKLHKGLGQFVSDARRDSGKFATALKRDFEKAQKTAASVPAQRSRTRRTSGRGSTRGGSSKRSGRSSS
jgi:hypothetical protein